MSILGTAGGDKSVFKKQKTVPYRCCLAQIFDFWGRQIGKNML